MHYFTVSGSTYFPAMGVTISEGLPTGTYQVGFSMERGFFLDRIDNITSGVPKFYGDLVARRDRIMNTFRDRRVNTGVMLSGSKGSGKSLLARAVCEEGLKQDMPVLVVNSPFTGEGFNALLNSVGRPFVLLLDEFEKVYHDQNDQHRMLSIFDGVYDNKILFMVTCNESRNLVDFFHNRPGRFFYAWEYGKLEPEFIREYAIENLKDPTKAESLVALSYLYWDFNFDILKAFVEDMNRYGETAKQVAAHLNAEPETGQNYQYEVVDYRIFNPTFFKETGKEPMLDPSTVEDLEAMAEGYFNESETEVASMTRVDSPPPLSMASLAKGAAKKGYWKPATVRFQGSPFQATQVTWYDKRGYNSVSSVFGPGDLKSFKYGEGVLKNKEAEVVFRRKYSPSYDYLSFDF